MLSEIQINNLLTRNAVVELVITMGKNIYNTRDLCFRWPSYHLSK